MSSLGGEFAEALFEKDFDRVRRLMDPSVEFRALTPRRSWEPADVDELIDGVLKVWFDDSDELERLVSIETGEVADRERVSYRFQGRNPEGPFVIEQQAYYAARDGRIAWMRVLCSGFRPPTA
jgi:hypothetical protein